MPTREQIPSSILNWSLIEGPPEAPALGVGMFVMMKLPRGFGDFANASLKSSVQRDTGRASPDGSVYDSLTSLSSMLSLCSPSWQMPLVSRMVNFIGLLSFPSLPVQASPAPTL